MGFPKKSLEYSSGWDARFDNRHILSCPFPADTQEGKDWIRGWVAAEQYLSEQPAG
jgi:hypothetical protein